MTDDQGQGPGSGSGQGAQQGHDQALRELLGPLALGHLPAAEETRVRAHLDGCAACRAELAEIAPLGAWLETVDPALLERPPAPPPGLGEQIRSAVTRERLRREADDERRRRSLARRRTTGRVRVGAIAAALVLVALGGGALVGRATAPQPAKPPLEAISLLPVGSSGSPGSPGSPEDEGGAAGVSVASADLVAHTWGVELRMVADGFDRGSTFRAAFRDADSGELSPAGEFIGTGAATMTCNLQSSALRDEVSEVVVTDASGSLVLRAAL